LYSKGIERLE